MLPSTLEFLPSTLDPRPKPKLLDNTKHLIFWLCNIRKQLNFRHFNTNRKKFTVTVNFSQKETKTAPKRPMLFFLVYQEIVSHFPTILDHFRRLPKIPEDWRRPVRKLPKISEEKSENPVLPRFSRILLRMGKKKETTAPLSTGSKFMDRLSKSR